MTRAFTVRLIRACSQSMNHSSPLPVLRPSRWWQTYPVIPCRSAIGRSASRSRISINRTVETHELLARSISTRSPRFSEQDSPLVCCDPRFPGTTLQRRSRMRSSKYQSERLASLCFRLSRITLATTPQKHRENVHESTRGVFNRINWVAHWQDENLIWKNCFRLESSWLLRRISRSLYFDAHSVFRKISFILRDVVVNFNFYKWIIIFLFFFLVEEWYKVYSLKD